MSQRLMPGCRISGCKERATPRSLFCLRHERNATSQRFADNKAKAIQQGRLGTADGFYNSRTWKRMRIMHLNSEPLCRDCGTAAQMVDHIQPIHLGGEPLDDSNLQSLCNQCHAKKRGAEGAARRKKNDEDRTIHSDDRGGSVDF